VSDTLFFIAVSLLLMHEMDAIDKKEWRLMFVLRRLPDEGAIRWYILIHQPLFVALLALVAAGPSTPVRWLETAVDAFLIVHLGLHERIVMRGDPAFDNPFSRWLIRAAAAVATIHIVLMVAGAP
jgi:hypothetical protein